MSRNQDLSRVYSTPNELWETITKPNRGISAALGTAFCPVSPNQEAALGIATYRVSSLVYRFSTEDKGATQFFKLPRNLGCNWLQKSLAERNMDLVKGPVRVC
jgi:hypothetical protein